MELTNKPQTTKGQRDWFSGPDAECGDHVTDAEHEEGRS